MSHDAAQTPAYKELAVAASGLRYSWGVYGENDQLGTLNRLTDEATMSALGEVRTGERFGVTLALTEPTPGFFGRSAPTHRIFSLGANVQDDVLDNFYLQGSSQWDGLRHRGDPELGYYGGASSDVVAGEGSELGIGAWAERGIIGRGILVDVARYHESREAAWHPLEGGLISAKDIVAVLQAQGTSIRNGDILLVRTGYVPAFLSASPEIRAAAAGTGRSAGLAADETMAAFLWDSGFAAVVADNPAVESAPRSTSSPSLHARLIPMLGFALGEFFNLERLAAACALDRRFSFLFAAVPLNLPSGVGSPANAVVIR